MKASVVIAFLAGVAVTVWLLCRIGLEAVFGAAVSVGWDGFLLIAVTGLAMEVLSGLGYWLLVPGKTSWPVFVASRQLRDSVGDILPFTQFAGMLAGVRVVAAGGAQAATAFAGLVVDVTAEFVAQIGFMALGLLLGLTALRSNAVLAPYVNGLILGTALLLPGAGLFVLLQHKGSALVERISARLLPAAVCHTEAFSQALTRLYGQPLRLAFATLLHLLSWIASGIWLWLTVRLTGAHLGLAQAIVIQSLLEAFRSAAVFVPSSIGVQEAGLTALAPVFGLAPEVGLAASLLRRARDVAIGLPVLLVWQIYEGRRALRRIAGENVRLP